MSTTTSKSIPFLWLAVAGLAAALAVVVLREPKLPAPPDPAAQKAQMEAAVHDYIVDNPEILQEAALALRQKEAVADAAAAKEQITQNQAALFKDDASVAVGSGVNVVEFFDYNCPYCRQSLGATEDIQKKPGVRFVFKEFPILGEGSVYAAKAAIASIKQGDDKYVAFHNAMMSYPGRIEEMSVLAVAAKVGLDVDKLKKDMADPKVQETIDRNIALARTIGVTGTPAFIVGDELIPGAVDFPYLSKMVDEKKNS